MSNENYNIDLAEIEKNINGITVDIIEDIDEEDVYGMMFKERLNGQLVDLADEALDLGRRGAKLFFKTSLLGAKLNYAAFTYGLTKAQKAVNDFRAIEEEESQKWSDPDQSSDHSE